MDWSPPDSSCICWNHVFPKNRRTFLSCLCVSQGKHVESEVLYRRAMASAAASVGTDHPILSIELTNLATLMSSQVRAVAHADSNHSGDTLVGSRLLYSPTFFATL